MLMNSTLVVTYFRILESVVSASYNTWIWIWALDDTLHNIMLVIVINSIISKFKIYFMVKSAQKKVAFKKIIARLWQL